MEFKKIAALFSMTILAISLPGIVFGYGLGDAESQILKINGNSYKIKTTISPEIIENQNQEFSFRVELIDASSEILAKNVDYSIKILDEKNKILFDADVGTNDDKLILTVISENKNDFSFSQEQNSGKWKMENGKKKDIENILIQTIP